MATSSSANGAERASQPMLFEALPEHFAPSRGRRKSPPRPPRTTVAERPTAVSAAVELAQFKFPFPRAREAAGKFVRDAIHEGMKDAAKEVVVTAIFASGAAAIGHFQYDVFGWKAKVEPPTVIKPWETTVMRARRLPVARP